MPQSLFPVSCLVSSLLYCPALCLLSSPTPCTEIPGQTFCCALLHSSSWFLSSKVPCHLVPPSYHSTSITCSQTHSSPDHHPSSHATHFPPSSPYCFFVTPTWDPESICVSGLFSCFLPLAFRICIASQDSHAQSLLLSQACPQQDSWRRTHSTGLQHDQCRQTLARF